MNRLTDKEIDWEAAETTFWPQVPAQPKPLQSNNWAQPEGRDSRPREMPDVVDSLPAAAPLGPWDITEAT